MPKVWPVIGTGVNGSGMTTCALNAITATPAAIISRWRCRAVARSPEADRNEEIAQRQATLEGWDSGQALGKHGPPDGISDDRRVRPSRGQPVARWSVRLSLSWPTLTSNSSTSSLCWPVASCCPGDVEGDAIALAHTDRVGARHVGRAVDLVTAGSRRGHRLVRYFLAVNREPTHAHQYAVTHRVLRLELEAGWFVAQAARNVELARDEAGYVHCGQA